MVASRRHYEHAFEAYLRARRLPYVAVDEARKALLPTGASVAPESAGRADLKSFDFVVYGDGLNLLLDVKGRRVAARAGGRNGAACGRLETWATEEDVRSLSTWERLCGEGFRAALVFVYWCDAPPPGALFQEMFEHRGRWYALRAVEVREYARAMTARSARWRTVHVPTAEFERISRPFCGVWLGGLESAGAGVGAAAQGGAALQSPMLPVWSS